MNTLEVTQKIIRFCLQLDDRQTLTRDTALLGGFPEFNSLTIVTLIARIETVLDCDIDDEELSAEIFETVGSVADFIDMKVASL